MQDVLKITKEELASVYGINLQKGKYGISNDSRDYTITQSNGDSSGCLLVGENKSKGMVSNSKHYETRLVQLMEAAEKRGESITIEIV